MKMHAWKPVFWIMAALLTVGVAHGQDLARMAVVDFNNKAGADPAMCSALVDMTMTAISKSGKFNLIERDALKKVAEEQNFGQGGAVDASSAVEMGKILGADYMLIGVVTELNAGEGQAVSLGGIGFGQKKVSIAADIRVVDCTTGEVKLAETFREERKGTAVALGNAGFKAEEGTGAEMARPMIDKISAKVVAAVYPPTILRYDESAGTVIINYGDMMFSVGDLCDVVSLGDPVTDPATNKVIGRVETKIGEIEITSADTKMSQGKIRSGQAQEGAIAKAKPEAEGKKLKMPGKRRG
jgi:curli biogenesis system outer membrane secretion channel CsgG